MARPGVQLLAACFLCATVESGDPQGLRGASRIGDRRGPGAVLDIPDSDAEDANSTAANTTEPLEGVVWVVEGPCRVSEDDGDCVESPNFPGGYGNGQRCAATLVGVGRDPGGSSGGSPKEHEHRDRPRPARSSATGDLPRLWALKARSLPCVRRIDGSALLQRRLP